MQIFDGNTKDVEMAVLLKYMSNFGRTLEMTLINCEINVILTWSSTYVITKSTGAGFSAMTDTKRFVRIVIFCFKITVNWNKY